MVLSISSTFVFAANVEYKQLEPNAFGKEGVDTTNLTGLIGAAFKIGLGIAVVLTIVMIIFGGIQYMTTESFSGKGDARKRITDALIGLGLALVSYLLLYIINPCLVDFTAEKGCEEKNKLLILNAPIPTVLNINKNV